MRHLLTCSPFRQVTIGKLSDNVLLKIFCFYLDASPPFWPTLAHICRKWRRIVFASFRLYITRGTPVSNTLDRRLALPIVVQYGGLPALDPPAPEDEENIISALKQSDRVLSISLTVTSSLLEKLSAIERPFSKLEDLVLLSRDSPRLALPSAFGRSTRLRSLHLTKIALLVLPQLLYSSRDLIDLQLHEVLNSWLLSPEALTDALSGMAQLQYLSLHFLPTTDHVGVTLSSRKRVVLPALTRLGFRGLTKYLGDLVSGINAPRLGDIEVTFSDEFISGPSLSQLTEFIDLTEMHKLHRHAHIISSNRAISIALRQPGTPTCLKLRFFRESLAQQLSTIARICIIFFAFLSNVEDLRISATRQPRGNNSLDIGRWQEPLNSFTGVKWFHVSGNLSADIMGALQLSDRSLQTLLPVMHKLYIPQPDSRHAPLTETVVSFITSRRRSGHHVAIEYEQSSHIKELPGAGRMHAECYHDTLLTYIA